MGKSKQDHIYFFWSTAIVLGMLLAFFALLFSSCSSTEDKPSVQADPALESIAPYDPDAPQETFQIGVFDDVTPSPTPQEGGGADQPAPGVVSTTSGATTLAETADMGQSYIDSFCFLGDSTTYGLGYYDKVPDAQVWTPASGTLTLSLWSIATVVYEDGSEITITEAAAKKQPAYLLITLGVNGVSFMSEEDFVKEYTNLVLAVKEASPDTKIILNSIYPVTGEYPSSSGITNDKINTANTWVARIAASTGCKYLDTQSILKDEAGALKADYDNGDNIHLNADTFDLVLNYIRTHGYI